jgi:hypothetical protein
VKKYLVNLVSGALPIEAESYCFDSFSKSFKFFIAGRLVADVLSSPNLISITEIAEEKKESRPRPNEVLRVKTAITDDKVMRAHLKWEDQEAVPEKVQVWTYKYDENDDVTLLLLATYVPEEK